MSMIRNRRVGKTPLQKYQYVLESYGLRGTELGYFLRSRGLHSVELKIWGAEMLSGLQSNMVVSAYMKTKDQKEIERLRKRLKEAEIVIEAQKKMEAFMVAEAQKTSLKAAKKRSK